MIKKTIVPNKSHGKPKGDSAEGRSVEGPLFDHSSQGIVVTGPDDGIVAVNPAFLAMTGLSERSLAKKKVAYLFPDERNAAARRALHEALAEGRTWQGDVRLRRRDGGSAPAICTAVPPKEKRKRGRQYYLFTDLLHCLNSPGLGGDAAYYDALTRLPNRRAFTERLTFIINRNRNLDSFCAVLLADLNRFHTVNNTMGYAGGDLLLQAAGGRLKSCVRELDSVFRLGNDEFAVIVDSFTHPEDVSMVARRVMSSCAPPFRLDNRDIYLTLSIGISICPSDGTTVEQLLKSAQTALNRAKEAGVNHGGMEGAELPGVADALVDFRPDFFREQSVVVPQEDKVAYLTFDDGPSARTVEILRVLDNYHVKATFFVVTKADAKSGQLLKKIAEAGHAVGMHSNSHAMAAIYASPQATLEDFSLNYDYILSVTGQAPSVFRFAGGSSNAKNPATGQFDSLIEMNRRGFVCFDWNASTGDAVSGQASKAKIIQNTINSTLDRQTVVLLAHDTPSKGTTVAALPEIIQFYQKAGYRFGTLGPETAPVLYASTRKAVLGLAG